MSNYGTFAGYVAYWLARGVVIAETEGETLPNLLIGSEYIDANYRSLYAGYKVNGRTQVRDWPRSQASDINYDIIPDTEVPTEVEYATYEAAYRQQENPGSLRTDVTMGKAISQVTIVGAVSVTYSGVGSVADLQIMVPQIEAILAPILTGGRGTSGLSGKSGRMI